MVMRHLRFVSILLAAVVVPAVLTLILFSVVLASTSATIAPRGGATLSGPPNQAIQITTLADDNSTGPCDWVLNIFGEHHIDVCLPLRLIVGAGASTVRTLYQSTAKQITFLWQTPLQPFQHDAVAHLITAWNMSWSLVLLSVTAVIAYAALRYMLGSVLSWLSYATLIELIPRIVFALLAALYSKQFFVMLIQANNALTTLTTQFNVDTLNIMLNQAPMGLINNGLQIVYGVLVFLLMLEEVVRIAILYVLFAFSPLLFFFAALRETQRWAKNAALAIVLFIFLQAMQAMVLHIGSQIMTSVIHPNPESVSAGLHSTATGSTTDLNFLNLLVSIAILYIALTLFFGVVRIALGRAGDLLAVAPFIVAKSTNRLVNSEMRGTISESSTLLRSSWSLWHPPSVLQFGSRLGGFALPGLPGPRSGGPGSAKPTSPPTRPGSGPRGTTALPIRPSTIAVGGKTLPLPAPANVAPPNAPPAPRYAGHQAGLHPTNYVWRQAQQAGVDLDI